MWALESELTAWRAIRNTPCVSIARFTWIVDVLVLPPPLPPPEPDPLPPEADANRQDAGVSAEGVTTPATRTELIDLFEKAVE
jgi:hypothetical protein